MASRAHDWAPTTSISWLEACSRSLGCARTHFTFSLPAITPMSAMPGRQHCRLNICRYIVWINKYSSCQFNPYIYKYWDGNAVKCQVCFQNFHQEKKSVSETGIAKNCNIFNSQNFYKEPFQLLKLKHIFCQIWGGVYEAGRSLGVEDQERRRERLRSFWMSGEHFY